MTYFKLRVMPVSLVKDTAVILQIKIPNLSLNALVSDEKDSF